MTLGQEERSYFSCFITLGFAEHLTMPDSALKNLTHLMLRVTSCFTRKKIKAWKSEPWISMVSE